MKVIIITGTPGTGKTSLAKMISKELKFKLVDVNKIIDQRKICEAYDQENECKIVNLQKLKKQLLKEIKESKENLIIESHLSHHLPKDQVDLCIVTKTDLKELNLRLIDRGYSDQKIRDNLDAEIFDLCLTEAQETGHNLLIVDTTHKINREELIKKIKEKIKLR